MKWLPVSPDGMDWYHHPSFAHQKLLIGTEDGRFLCLDCQGKLYAGGKLESGILSLDTDGRLVVAGCQDGSIRVWIMTNGEIQMIHTYLKAHTGGVTAIALGRMIEDMSVSMSTPTAGNSLTSPTGGNGSGSSSTTDLLVSGSDDCSIRIWRIWYE